MAGVNDEAIDGDHPGQWILLDPAGECPVRVEETDLQQILDLFRFIAHGTFGKAKSRRQIVGTHMWLLRLIKEKVDTELSTI